MHADVWLKQLAQGNAESKERMQNAVNETFNLALGIFEKGNFGITMAGTCLWDVENDHFINI